MRDINVVIMEEHGGFIIRVDENHPGNIYSSELFHFDQEDSVKDLVNVFKEIGINATYEEVY